MADDRTLENVLIGFAIGAIATYIIMTFGQQIILLNQQLSTYNQYAMYQQQYSRPQITQQYQYQYQYPQPQLQPQVQSSQVQQTQPQKRLYTVERDADGYILLPE